MITKQIASDLAISIRTIETHIARAKEKYGAATIPQLVAIATRDGIVANIEPQEATP